MNKESNVHDDHPGADELGLRLEAYASARLSPNRKAAARIRSALIEEARMRRLAVAIGGAPRSGRAGARRIVALLLAAGLTVAGAAGVVNATSPGGPLYGARIWLETNTLPANADARAMERIHLIDERVEEAQRAAATGDEHAVSAAIAAYRDAVEAALTDAGTVDDRVVQLKAALGLHVVVLETLSDRLPAAAAKGIERAIEASHQAVDRLDTRPGDQGKPGDHPGPPETPGGGGPNSAP